MWSNTAVLNLSLFSIWLLVVFAAPCNSKDLKCYLCASKKSWDECEKNKYLAQCHPGHDEVCIKLHLVEYDDNTETEYKQTFAKMCGRASLCTNKDCLRHSKNCQVKCCHSDLCNTATRRNVHVEMTLLGAVCLALLYLCLC